MKLLKEIKHNSIIRRYIIMNSFDGALTVLGIILASFFAGLTDPRLLILPIVGAAVAMFISGTWGAYMAETAEIKNKIKELEKHMFKKLSKTEFSNEAHRKAFLVAFVNGLNPLLVSFIILIPFFLAAKNIISMTYAYYASLILLAIIVFVSGAYSGKIAKENMIKRGFIMLLAGFVIALIFFILFVTGLL
ncbi:MAG: hypothetical protein GY861_09845 [bacterium]|nr:hypothetical protein [bacterium]